MNKVILCGRLTKDPVVRVSQGEGNLTVARYTLAVERRRSSQDGQREADFINCVVFGKAAEFTEKYLKKGTKIILSGRIQTGSYINNNGQKVYTTDVVVEEQEFAESKKSTDGNNAQASGNADYAAEDNGYMNDGFMNIPDGLEDDELPFN